MILKAKLKRFKLQDLFHNEVDLYQNWNFTFQIWTITYSTPINFLFTYLHRMLAALTREFFKTIFSHDLMHWKFHQLNKRVFHLLNKLLISSLPLQTNSATFIILLCMMMTTGINCYNLPILPWMLEQNFICYRCYSSSLFHFWIIQLRWFSSWMSSLAYKYTC